ncbi:uncharacterized protein C4orf17 homolog isoform X1 [Microcebus murinus]|uniref:uncharacterized protein C4orf17 homolog isoform X1 n=1 Tax=Microcebus murinus TaxID=30608 RepID=UPI003F6C5911
MNLKSSTSTPQFLVKGSRIKTRNESYFLVRHTPHPRRVCHIKGLNNVPICTVNDDDNVPWVGDQPAHSEKDETPRASCPPSAAAPRSPARRVSPASNSVRMPPRPHSEPSRKIEEWFKTSIDNPLVIKKEEIKAKKPPSTPKVSSTAGSCSSGMASTKNEVKANTVCIPNYLDQEIKILAKLCDILHTDSLAEVLQWLLHASSKEKEWVSALVHSELAEINLLTSGRSSASKEPVTGTGKPLTGTGKPLTANTTPAATPPNSPAKPTALSSIREELQPARLSSQGSEGNKGLPQEADHKPPLFIRRNKMKIPVTDYFGKPKSPPRPNSQDCVSTKPMSAKSIQQGYNLCPQRAFYPSAYERQKV